MLNEYLHEKDVKGALMKNVEEVIKLKRYC